MNKKELFKFLDEKKINLKDFRMVYYIPSIEIEKGKNKVTQFELKFEIDNDDYVIW